MTADVINFPLPRTPLVNEMHAAFDQAISETDSQRHRFYAGLGLGYAVAFGLVTREALDRARIQPGALPLHIDFRSPRKGDDDDTLWACGVRHGYLLATSERPDARECDLCGERITDDDPSESCEHGTYCDNHDCIRSWHSGVTLHPCVYTDGM